MAHIGLFVCVVAGLYERVDMGFLVTGMATTAGLSKFIGFTVYAIWFEFYYATSVFK